MTRRCASQTRSPLTDSLYKAKKSWRRSTWSATSRWCPLSSSSFFTSTPSSPLWSSRSQPGCGPCSKLVEGLWLSARRSHRSSEVHRLPTAGVQVRMFALGLRLLLLFCVFYYNITLQPRKHCVLDGLRALSEFGGKSGCWEAQLGQVALFVFFLFSKYHLQDCVDRHHVFDHHSGQYYDHLLSSSSPGNSIQLISLAPTWSASLIRQRALSEDSTNEHRSKLSTLYLQSVFFSTLLYWHLMSNYSPVKHQESSVQLCVSSSS